MRQKKLIRNTISPLIFELTTVICGFILPKCILHAYGSQVNGLVSSITQFLTVITFLELGVGAVVCSSLYKPLAESDLEQVSRIMVSCKRFYNKIALILSMYVVVLMLAYPTFVDQRFDRLYTMTLIAAISISILAQYYFGIVNRLLLSADQRGYIQYNIQTSTLILNTILCVVLIQMGAGIHVVKLTASLVYVLRPLVLCLYVKRNYAINWAIKYDKEPIAQKWNGVAQHIVAFILDGTDTIVLTIFSTLSNVSIYYVYHLVVYGVKKMFMSATGGFQALLGELWAKQEVEELRKTFDWFEWLLHTGTTYFFGCTGVLILPFIQVYTQGIEDVNYYLPVFAVLITLANAGHCLRLPYNIMILATGHYKQTQHCFIIAATMNIGLSILLVIHYGLVGVAIGTLVSMLYQTVWMAYYNDRHLIHGTFMQFIKHVLVDTLTILCGTFATAWLTLTNTSFLAWGILAVVTAAIWALVLIAVNLLCYRRFVLQITKSIHKRITG